MLVAASWLPSAWGAAAGSGGGSAAEEAPAAVCRPGTALDGLRCAVQGHRCSGDGLLDELATPGPTGLPQLAGGRYACLPPEHSPCAYDFRLACPQGSVCQADRPFCTRLDDGRDNHGGHPDLPMVLRTDAHAVASEAAHQATNEVGGMKGAVCAAVRALLPHSCSSSGVYCTTIGCNLSVLGDNLAISLDLNPCSGPHLVSLEVKYPPIGIDSSNTLSTCQKVFASIPGLDWSIKGVGLAAQVDTMSFSVAARLVCVPS